MDSTSLPAGMLPLIKQATRELILAVGGPARVEALTGHRAGTISRWGADHHGDVIPVTVVAVLEFHAQAAPFTRALASLTGHGLTRIADGDDSGGGPGMADVAAIAASGARVVAAAAEALADGVVTPAEAKHVMSLIGGGQAEAGAFKRKLAVVAGGGR